MTKEKKEVTTSIEEKPKRKRTTKKVVKEEVITEPVIIKEEIIPVDNVVITKSENSKKHTTFNIVEVLALMFGTLIVCVMLGVIVGRGMVNNYSSDEQTLIDEVIKNYRIIKDEYDIDESKLLNNIIKGMLGSVDDPYASFIEKDSNFETELAGRYSGFGIQITTYNNEIVIIDVFDNTSASEAGLKVGDIVLKVDDLDLTDKTNKDFTNYVKNSSKKKFDLVIKRNEEEIKITVEKRETIIPSVYSKIIEQDNKKIGYIQTTIFSGTTYTQFKEQLEKLEKQEIDSLIVDLRGNSGGRADIVANMVSLFVDSKHLVYQTDNKGEIEKFYSTGSVNKKYSIAILVNNDSASASEIMASALSEQMGAILVGEKTYGKGTVQQVKTLSTGAEYKLTTKLWLTSKGISINKVGLTPNYEVKLNDEYYTNPSDETDNQLKKAIELLNK